MKKNKKWDKLIESVYYRVANGVQIRILDIPKVFQAGYAALETGQDLESAIVNAVNQLRYN